MTLTKMLGFWNGGMENVFLLMYVVGLGHVCVCVCLDVCFWNCVFACWFGHFGLESLA